MAYKCLLDYAATGVLYIKGNCILSNKVKTVLSFIPCYVFFYPVVDGVFFIKNSTLILSIFGGLFLIPHIKPLASANATVHQCVRAIDWHQDTCVYVLSS